MDPIHKRVLRKNQPYLVKNLDIDGELLDQLIADEVLSDSHMGIISAKSTKDEKIRELLSILPRCGPEAFDQFITAIDQDYVVTQLQKTLKDLGCPDTNINRQPLKAPEPSKSIQVAVQATDPQPEKPNEPSSMDNYPIGSSPGRLLIITNNQFHDREVYPDRNGTTKDIENVKNVFKQHHFEDPVEVTNCTVAQMKAAIEAFATDPRNAAASSAVCVIGSHGQDGDIIAGTDGTENGGLSVNTVVDLFGGETAKGLIGKPKLLLIQACRGSKVNPGTSQEVSDSKSKPQKQDQHLTCPRSNECHTKADQLVVLATCPGEKSWRNQLDGSWMIQEFCEVLRENGRKEHIHDIITKVNYRVSKKNPYVEENKGLVFQLMEITSRLTKKWYLVEPTRR